MECLVENKAEIPVDMVTACGLKVDLRKKGLPTNR